MIPISDDNPTLRRPVMTYLLLGVIGWVWFYVQRMGMEPALAKTVCELGLVPGELTRMAPVGEAVPLGENLACIVDREPINWVTPLTSMFLHGGWVHLLGNCLFLWVFGNNVEDSMGRLRFPIFYVLCGLAAAGAQVVMDPSSPVPMVGASGAISGVMGAYLVLYPRVRVNMLIPIFIFIQIVSLPAWLVLLWWFGLQLLSGLPQVLQVSSGVTEGVAFWAHIGGFIAGVLMVKAFENPALVRARTSLRHRLHPTHP